MKDGEKLQIGNWIVEKVEMDGVDFMEVRGFGRHIQIHV